jgi:hypothetical protein
MPTVFGNSYVVEGLSALEVLGVRRTIWVKVRVLPGVPYACPPSLNRLAIADRGGLR